MQIYNKQILPNTDYTLIPPCQAACPLQMDIREYIDLVAQGRIIEALNVIRNDNPFPAICSYVCTHPCEIECRRGQVDKPVAIRAIKRFAVEFGGDRMIQTVSDTIHSEKVAVIGSGPAGMSCSYYLRKMGYPVTIFECNSEIGGMLRVGIPQYRLPREVLDIEARRLLMMGVDIRLNTRVVSLDLIFDMGYKAIFITVGAHQGLRLDIEGGDLPGVIDGATFLREINLGLKPDLGKNVAIIGGGNVAIDAARTALRCGAEKVKVVYRRTINEMPADKSEIGQAYQEGIDFQFLTAPVKIERADKKLLVTCIRMELTEADESGRRKPVPIECSEFKELYDTVITAIGQLPQLPTDFKLRIGHGSTIEVDPITLTTNRTGVFAGGDAVTGPATVTEALAAGKKAARRIDDYLQHRYPVEPVQTRRVLEGKLSPQTIEVIKKIGRFEPTLIPPETRIQNFIPVESTYNWDTAVNEARRCLRCGTGAQILFEDKCATCLTCVRICPYHVPKLDARSNVVIPEDQCQACGICVDECPAHAIILRKTRERISINTELAHTIKSAQATKIKPKIAGFCCQYGLFGTGQLSRLWRETRDGIWIIPVPCIAKLERIHILTALENYFDGIFIAGCGDQCSRKDTVRIVTRRINKIAKILDRLHIESERIKLFNADSSHQDVQMELDQFTSLVASLYLAETIRKEKTNDYRCAKIP